MRRKLQNLLVLVTALALIGAGMAAQTESFAQDGAEGPGFTVTFFHCEGGTRSGIFAIEADPTIEACETERAAQVDLEGVEIVRLTDAGDVRGAPIQLFPTTQATDFIFSPETSPQTVNLEVRIPDAAPVQTTVVWSYEDGENVLRLEDEEEPIEELSVTLVEGDLPDPEATPPVEVEPEEATPTPDETTRRITVPARGDAEDPTPVLTPTPTEEPATPTPEPTPTEVPATPTPEPTPTEEPPTPTEVPPTPTPEPTPTEEPPTPTPEPTPTEEPPTPTPEPTPTEEPPTPTLEPEPAEPEPTPMEVEEELGMARIELHSSDEDGRELYGSVFALQPIGGTVMAESILPAINEPGRVAFVVEPGEWLVTQTVAPSGYALAARFEVTVEADQVVIVPLELEPLEGVVTLPDAHDTIVVTPVTPEAIGEDPPPEEEEETPVPTEPAPTEEPEVNDEDANDNDEAIGVPARDTEDETPAATEEAPTDEPEVTDEEVADEDLVVNSLPAAGGGIREGDGTAGRSSDEAIRVADAAEDDEDLVVTALPAAGVAGSSTASPASTTLSVIGVLAVLVVVAGHLVRREQDFR